MAHAAPNAPAPYTFTIEGAQGYSGLARTRLFEAIKTGDLETKKAGRRTLIVGDSLRAFLDRLPSTKKAA